FYFLFSYHHGAHRDLPSFPTRRSSDLPRISFHRLGLALDIYAFDTRRGRITVNDHFVETPAHRTCEAPEPDDWRAAALLRIACGDRKSTRLNSSHVKISYAVFCLKKKK